MNFQSRTRKRWSARRRVHLIRTVANRGQEMVSEVARTMSDISESSKEIGDMLGMIEGIGFQTNILALNAAVEAARAGEQGREFAVETTHVRFPRQSAPLRYQRLIEIRQSW